MEGPLCSLSSGSSSRSPAASRDWSTALPKLAIFLIMERLLPSLSDLLSAIRVSREWLDVFSLCKRELLSDLPPFLFTGRFSVYGEHPPTIYSVVERRLFRHRDSPEEEPDDCVPRRRSHIIVGTSHGYLMVADVCSRRLLMMDPLSSEGIPSSRGLVETPEAPHDLSLASVFMTAPPSSPLCVVLAFHRCHFQYWRRGETAWSSIDFPRWVVHVEYHGGGDADKLLASLVPRRTAVDLQGRLYALYMPARLLFVESYFPRLSTVVFDDIPGLPRGTHHEASLVESNGDILYVCDRGEERRRTRRPKHDVDVKHRFEVRRLDLAARKWVRVRGLGGRALFLNVYGSPSISCEANKLGDGDGDRIYFLCSFSISWAVYHMEDGSTEHHPLSHAYRTPLWGFPSPRHS
uniref:F-box/kelch-repeat protein At1g64840 n=1 Tax=Anthurium amnicola TaxID=1678845 RepID=A0A1D1Y9I6_9ARAE